MSTSHDCERSFGQPGQCGTSGYAKRALLADSEPRRRLPEMAGAFPIAECQAFTLGFAKKMRGHAAGRHIRIPIDPDVPIRTDESAAVFNPARCSCLHLNNPIWANARRSSRVKPRGGQVSFSCLCRHQFRTADMLKFDCGRVANAILENQAVICKSPLTVIISTTAQILSCAVQ